MSCQERIGAGRPAWVDYSTAHTKSCMPRQVLDARLQEPIFADYKRLSATAWTQLLRNYFWWQMYRIHYDCDWWRKSVSFHNSRILPFCFLLCSGKLRVGKNASNESCHTSVMPHICMAWPSDACEGRMRGILPFALSCLPFSVSLFS